MYVLTQNIDFRFGENDSEDSTKTGLQLIYATGRQMKNKKQLLLLPITIWSGLEQGFFGADFTAVNIYHKLSLFGVLKLTMLTLALQFLLKQPLL